MKKYLAVLAFSLLLLPLFIGQTNTAYAAANPFMDVPAGHWAYDAIGQLAAKGVLSGYPDGAYGGGRTVTRYEMASGLARALAVMDTDKADAEDLEVISRLGVEFQDEFYALNVKVSDANDKLNVLEENLSGWRISGTMIMDIESWRDELWTDSPNRDGYVNFTRARLYLDRWFGEYDEMYFHGAIDGAGSLSWQNFYVEFPALFDTIMTVGRFEWDWESAYNFYTGGVSDLAVGSYLTDRSFDGFGITKSFSLGVFQAFIQRRPLSDLDYYVIGDESLWEAMMTLRLQLTEQIGADMGVQYFLGDDGSHWSSADLQNQFKFDSQYTLYGGLRYEFSDNVGLRGIYYHQDEMEADYRQANTWYYLGGGSSNAYRIVLDVKQEQLGFTSLWLSYDFMDGEFFTGNGGDGSFDTVSVWTADGEELAYDAAYDMQTWRLGATQQWNDRWRTWLYLAHHSFDGAADDGGDINGIQAGAGVEYRLNPSVGFALNYVDSAFDEGANSPGDNHLIRFRTQIDF